MADRTTRAEWRVVLGLPLLWVTGYALPLLGQAGDYFRPRGPEILWWPALVALILLVPLHLACWHARAQGRLAAVARGGLMVTGLCLALLNVFHAADYGWPRLLEWCFGPDTRGLMKASARVVTVLLATVLVYALGRRGRLPVLARALGAAGLAFAVLMAWRLVQQDLMPVDVAPGAVRTPVSVAVTGQPPATRAVQRVVWVIFDEMDEGLALEQAGQAPGMPHFSRLRQRALTAVQAWSPARDTVASLPALLTGRRVDGYRYAGPARLALHDPDLGGEFLFKQADTVFARLPGGPARGTLDGFYHPYCAILGGLGHCRSRFLALAGEPTDVLTFLAPKFLHRSFNEHYRVTRDVWPAFIERVRTGGDALNFGHVNVPHLPAAYAFERLKVPLVRDQDGMYRLNMRLADELLGELLQVLETPGAPDTLLIVSADHWFRAISPQTARPVPYLLWHVGHAQGLRLQTPVSTVHTAALVEQVLAGRLAADPLSLAAWLREQPVWMPWIPQEPGGGRPDGDGH